MVLRIVTPLPRSRRHDLPDPWHHVAAMPAAGMVPVSDRRLAELLARLADGWEAMEPAERERLAAGVSAVLDLAGVRAGGNTPRCRVARLAGD